MSSERLEEMFKEDSADRRARKFPLVSMGGRADTSSESRKGATNIYGEFTLREDTPDILFLWLPVGGE